METKKTIKGGEFLITETPYEDIFIPEEFDEEQQMIAQTCRDFLAAEINPILDRIDSQEEGLMPSLMDKAGELGILGVSIQKNLVVLAKISIPPCWWPMFVELGIHLLLHYRRIRASEHCQFYIMVMWNKKRNIFPNWGRGVEGLLLPN
jgi:hypothetical protein